MNWAIQNLNREGFGNTKYKLVLSAMIYHVWGERNARIFNDKARNKNMVFRDIERDVRDRCWFWKMVVITYCNWLL